MPYLRIEAGMHTSGIKRFDTDAAGRTVLTVGEDKSARLWDLKPASETPDGQPALTLLRPFRFPIGVGNEGKLYCAALSPDGSLAAFGGWTGAEWDGKGCVYVFDTTTGRMTHRLGGMPSIINDVAFSRSGRRLAVGLGERYGLCVWELPSGRLAGVDSEYGDQTLGVDWHGDEHLATACIDGFVRVYQLSPPDGTETASTPATLLSPRAKAEFQGGKFVYSVQYSPDGASLGVSTAYAPVVAVLDSQTLKRRTTAPTAGVLGGDLCRLAWSADGRTLAAGGTGRLASGVNLVRVWPEAGRASGRDFVACQENVSGIEALPDGSFLYTGFEPSVGLVPAGKPTGTSPYRPRMLAERPTAAYGGAGSVFSVSDDGGIVSFGYQVMGGAPARFAVRERLLSTNLGSQATQGLKPPRITGLALTDWQNLPSPKLNGQPLYMETHDISSAIAIAPDTASFLLGSSFSLRRHAADGTILWGMTVPSTAWAVNFSGDGRFAVAAFADGTIRWHRADTGQELLAFFPHADRKRWILWTPEGHYDCSPGAEDLIGWHVNRGPDQAADFFPAAKFRETFYRPDVVSRVLDTMDVILAAKSADEASGRKPVEANVGEVVARMQPPVIELAVGGSRSEAEVTGDSFDLRYRVRSATAEPVTRVRVLVDGRPLAVEAPIPASQDSEASVAIPAPGRDCVVSLLAENRFAVSEPATLRLTRASQSAPAAPAAPAADEVPAALKPRLYLLAVGVNDYQKNEHLPDLNYAAKDATDFSAVFQKQEGGLYQKVETRLLTDAGATAADVLDGLDWIKQETTAKDLAIVFFAGHGENDEELRYYFCPSDYDPKRRLRSGVAMEDIQKTLASIPGKVLFFIDTCHAGNALGKLFASRSAGGGGPDINRLVNELSSAENGAIVFASSTGRQQSIESADWQNGAFTKALVEGLSGQADLLKNGKITVSTLESWVAERVKELSDGQQTPTVAKPQTVPDFPIAVKR